jgi:acyl-CoA thioesterase-1
MKYFSLFLLFVFVHALYTTNVAQSGEKNVSPLTITILGDSLIAGYGLEEQNSYPSKLEKALQAENKKISILNAGVSGDTTAGGLERLEWTLADNPDVLVISLGANDGLRAVDPNFSRANLEKIILKARELNPDMKILLLGMLAPPNLGKNYAAKFNVIYPELSEKYDTPLYPFLLDGVILDQSLNQSDGIHPNAKGVDVMVKKTLPFFLENIY